MKHSFLWSVALAVSTVAGAMAETDDSPTPLDRLDQAADAFEHYDPATARSVLTTLNKCSDSTIIVAADSLRRQITRMEEMLQRVDNITIVDSFNVNREDFFRNYRIAPAAGSLLSVAEVGTNLNAADPTVVYMPENGALMLWGTDRGLVESRRFTDGTWEEAHPLGETLNGGGTANYPFLLSDGMTLYFASDAHDSLGGLDLYVSRRNGNEFAAPQNMGMPYNSPFDDYMLAIDEYTGAGWWASDRNLLDGLVTIYVFEPTAARVNVNADSVADITAVARGKVYADSVPHPLKAKIAAVKPAKYQKPDVPDFTLNLPDGRVYTHWSDFKSSEARSLMESYVAARNQLLDDEARLAELRAAFKPKADGQQIIKLENKVRANRTELRRLANKTIETELQ